MTWWKSFLWTNFEPRSDETDLARIFHYVNQKPELAFRGHQQTDLNWASLDNVYIYSGRFYLAAMEEVLLVGNTLRVGHYALVKPEYAGQKKGYGAQLVRNFVSVLRKENPVVTEIHFEERTFQARKKQYLSLFNRLQAVQCTNHIDCYIVKV